MAEFGLGNLTRVRDAARADVAELRRINAARREREERLTEDSALGRSTPQYVHEQIAATRERALAEATRVLADEIERRIALTLQHATPWWERDAFLARVRIQESSPESNARAATLSRSSLKDLTAAAGDAAEQTRTGGSVAELTAAIVLLADVAGEVRHRVDSVTSDGGLAAVTRASTAVQEALDSARLPDYQTAQGLLAELPVLAAQIASTKLAISAGIEDVEVRVEKYRQLEQRQAKGETVSAEEWRQARAAG